MTALVYDRRGRLLATGRNSYTKTHTLMYKTACQVEQKPGKIYLHAEVAALLKVGDWKKAYRIVIMRFKADGSPGLAKPCKTCQHIINQTGIKQIDFTLG